MTKTQTLITTCEALTFKACRLVDSRDAGSLTAAVELETVRAERDAIKAAIRARRDGRTYDRGYA